MTSEELRQLTASEPLTLEEEYEMQQKWQIDEDKLTFIILSRENGPLAATTEENIKPTDPRLSECPMVGDVNLFLSGTLQDLQAPLVIRSATEDMDPSGPELEEENESHAEVEIMIAEPAYRRKGYALEALQLMLEYGTGHKLGPVSPITVTSESLQTVESPLKISPTRLLTRIAEDNVPSVRLFEKLGFHVTKRVSVFQEIELRWRS
ncbi:N-acetyltransferase 9-like protein [Coprinopsis marcescibilis]|uniref:N-acetyltransferase 9-like protein n=1 Tax=Coprinopsis marcescibilis TaxID=230819 RepID=A0A5C3L0W0_COPMA|nr:N-acetyltransferase 9-like protein [Coprinopsis marcescibilis]